MGGQQTGAVNGRQYGPAYRISRRIGCGDRPISHARLDEGILQDVPLEMGTTSYTNNGSNPRGMVERARCSANPVHHTVLPIYTGSPSEVGGSISAKEEAQGWSTGCIIRWMDLDVHTRFAPLGIFWRH